MKMEHTFKFANDGLNKRLIALLKKSNAKYFLDKNGIIHYAENDEEHIENDIVCRIRDAAFPRWKIIHCSSDWLDSYKSYMISHGVPFYEELIDGETCFLIPRNFRPHAWKLCGPRQPAAHKRVG